MNITRFRVLLPLALSLMLAACAHQTIKPPPAARPQAKAETKPELPTRPFSKDALYDLLLAEIAENRNRPDVALTRYIKQARETRDPNVLSRATLLAQYVNAQPLTMELAELWLKADPENQDGHYLLILNALRNERFDLAIPAMDRLLKLSPDADLEPIFLSALPATKEGRNKLLTALNGLSPDGSRAPHVLFARALVLEQNGDLEGALASVQELQQSRRSISSVLLEAKLLTELKRDPQAEAVLAAALKDQPESRPLRLNYARMLVRTRKLESAEKQFSELVSRYPDDSETRLALALLAKENKHDDVARAQLQALLEQNSHNDVAHYYLAGIARQSKDLTTARAELEAIEPGSLFLAAQAELVEMFVEQKDIPAARARLAAARDLAPELSPQLYIMEAELLNKHNQTDAAYELLTAGLKSEPKNEMLLYNRAMAAEKLNHLEVFESDMHDLLKQEPDNATALNALGYTLADRTDRLKEAADYIGRALALKPDDPAIIDSMGWLKYRLGDTRGALEYLQKAYSLMPDDEIAAHLGEVLWAAGRREEARQVWAGALQKEPQSEFVLKTRSRLDPTL